MSEALSNVSRKQSRLLEVQKRTAKVIQELRDKETKAEEDLENVIAFVLDGKHATLTAIMKSTGYSNSKVKGMAERARRRNIKLMRSGYDD